MPVAKKPTVDPLQKKIPKNPKYDYVHHTIDTGSSVSNYMRKVEEIRTNYKLRNDELFKRMKISTFVQLVIQVTEINRMRLLQAEVDEEDETPRFVGGDVSERTVDKSVSAGSPLPTLEIGGQDSNHNGAHHPPPDTDRSSLQSVIRGIGEFDITHPPRKKNDSSNKALTEFPDDMPYLLLDVREYDDYQICHLIKALSYPYTMISRSVNFETREMLACRNKPGKIIVIYDEDERIAPKVATTLVQRGYDNLFMISGGLKVAAQKFPQGLITGTLPASCRPPVTKKPKFLTKTGPHPPDTNRSTASSVASSVYDNGPPSKVDFTLDDIAQLQEQVDKNVDDNSSRYSSRMSHATRTSTSHSNVTSSQRNFKM